VKNKDKSRLQYFIHLVGQGAKMKKSLIILLGLLIAANAFAVKVAVFPVQTTNTDKSFSDAFGMLLSNKYAKIANCSAIPPTKAAKAVPSDGNLSSAAQALGADEYLEITAVGLYVSRKEANETYQDSSSGAKQVIVIREKGDHSDDDEEKSDRKLLDNSKTIVTIVRKSASGSEIYQTEMTLLTYGDIEESTERMAASLFQKVSVDKTRGMTNITRREGMGYNQMWTRKCKGFKMGAFYPFSSDTVFSTVITLGFDYKVDLNRAYIEFGTGARIPSGLDNEKRRIYGGAFFELGGGYYIVDNVIGVYTGAGLIPFFNFANISSSPVGCPVYLQIGFCTPRNASARFYGNLRIAQNMIAIITTRSGSDYVDGYYTSYSLRERSDYPTEIGFEIGIGW
jgi:hypothetical protein